MFKTKLESKHYQWGLTAFLVIICSVLAFFAVYKFNVLEAFFGKCVEVMSPFIYGLVMAYLLCPVYNFTVKHTYSYLNRSSQGERKGLGKAKLAGTLVSLVTLLVVVTGVTWMIIPGLIDSVIKIIDILPGAIDNLLLWSSEKFASHPFIEQTIDAYTDSAMDYITNIILPKTGVMAAEFSAKVLGAVGIFMNLIIGVIVCVYFLNIKDTLAAQCKKIIFATFKEETAEEILGGAEYTNRTFGGFINGKIIDSIIIGIICFIVMSIFGWEYTLLISSIVAITNIIPFFGPFIGAIPSTLLLLLVNPMHALYFLILIVLLQQFDGNILGPKILGDRTGLSSFWVLFAILVGGGLFGFIGMVIGVPVFAVIYAYCSRALNRKLLKKGLSIEVDDYKVDKYGTDDETVKQAIVRKIKRKKKEEKEKDMDEAEVNQLEDAIEYIKHQDHHGHKSDTEKEDKQ